MEQSLKKNILFLLSILFASCVTNPPVDSEEIESLVVIKSNISNAAIFLDDRDTGKLTPDSIIVTQGEHKIRLEKIGYLTTEKSINISSSSKMEVFFELEERTSSKVVLLEDFANVSCDPCVVSNSILRKLKTKYNNEIAIIKFSTNFPSPNDPFYLAGKGFNDSRMSYYNIFAAPTVIVDGIERPIPTDSSDIIEKIESRLLLDSPFNIEVSDSITSSEFHVRVSVDVNDMNINLNDYVLYTCVVEEEIKFNNPPGSNGEIEFYDVMRSQLPNSNGAAIIYNDRSNNMEFFTQIDSEWDTAELFSVTFVQHSATGEIVQAISSKSE